MEHHSYSVILTDADEKHRQPERITQQLKPHQLAGLQKAFLMEQYECVHYNVENPRDYIPFGAVVQPTLYGAFTLKSNVGIIGDIVGYGKTMIALSIIAALKTELIYMPPSRKQTYQGVHSYMEITKASITLTPLIINTTLVVVPRGPVYIQWKNTIRSHTTLSCLSIESLVFIKKSLPKNVKDLKTYLERFDIVLIKNTTLTTMIDYYNEIDEVNEIEGFDRIMIDEAHIIIIKVPYLSYKFLWLITSSYRELLYYNNNYRSIYSGVFQMLHNSIERLHYILIKGDASFVKGSFHVPPPIERYYVCKQEKHLIAIQPFLSPSLNELINVNDIAGAIRELGGISETPEELIKLVLKDIEKNIMNTKREITFVETLEMDQEHRLNILKNELNRYTTRKTSIEEKLKEVDTKICSICYDVLDNPIYLNCSHMFCGQCIFNWIQANTRTTRTGRVQCPECRTDIDSSKIVAVVKEKVENNTVAIIVSKEDQLIDIIMKKPEGRFLVFSRVDTTFGKLAHLLNSHSITHTEIKGSTTHMMRILDDFVAKRTRVIMLNTYHAGCGIDISSATDVIIYHSMPHEKIQAIGRAQRVGRTDQLTIHNLCFPNEMK